MFKLALVVLFLSAAAASNETFSSIVEDVRVTRPVPGSSSLAPGRQLYEAKFTDWTSGANHVADRLIELASRLDSTVAALNQRNLVLEWKIQNVEQKNRDMQRTINELRNKIH